jgi:hypothetical protein
MVLNGNASQYPLRKAFAGKEIPAIKKPVQNKRQYFPLAAWP